MKIEYCAKCGHPDYEHRPIEERELSVNVCRHVPSDTQADATGLMRCNCDAWLDPPTEPMSKERFDMLYIGQFPTWDSNMQK